MPAFVYMLRCSDGSFYVGSTRGESMERRYAEHQSGAIEGYTSRRRPVTLVWSQAFERITDAIAAERQLKGWSRATKLALIEGDWQALHMHAKRRGGGPPDRSGLGPSRPPSAAPQDEE